MFPLHFLGTHSSFRTAFCYLDPVHYNSRSGLARICGRRFGFGPCIASPPVAFSRPPPVKLRTFGCMGSDAIEKCTEEKPSVCTADELHYVSVRNSDWRLALWRYRPPPNAQPRNHPLLLLSGVATNAIGYDLSPESSFARYMSRQGFDTWILEVRGTGLSTRRSESREVKQPVNVMSGKSDSAYNRGTNGIHFAETPPGMNFTFDAFRESKISSREGKGTETVTRPVESQLVTKLTDTIALLSEKLGFLDEGVLTIKQNSAVASQIRDLSQRLLNTIKSQRSVSPQYFDLADFLSTTIVTIEDFQKQIDLIVKYDWDFDHHLEEDLPAAMDYIRAECKPKDDKLLAIGHSMGGILLYAMISGHGFNGKDSGLASVVTLASSLDYTTSRSSLKYLLPVADPAQALNVPVMPLGAILAAAFPFASRPPYVMSWLNPQISAENMMHPELFEKLVLNNFGTVPTKLLVQLTTAFRGGGLCDRSGTFFYKDHLRRTNVPILALAGDQDLICPPEAVYETIKLIPEHLIKYKVFGEPGGPHYAHYDLVVSRLAASQVYPCIIEFLSHHDMN